MNEQIGLRTTLADQEAPAVLTLCTIGYEKMDAPEFFGMLRESGMRRVLDIRLYPSGRGGRDRVRGRGAGAGRGAGVRFVFGPRGATRPVEQRVALAAAWATRRLLPAAVSDVLAGIAAVSLVLCLDVVLHEIGSAISPHVRWILICGALMSLGGALCWWLRSRVAGALAVAA